MDQLLLRAGRYDLIILVLKDGATTAQIAEVREMAYGIREDTEATIAIFPERVLADATTMGLAELIMLRDELDAVIEHMAADPIGEA